MLHETALIATIAGGLAFAFLFGFIAARLHLPPLVGYLLAGIVVGPFTPGITADPHLAAQLAEIGVMLLMFGSITLNPLVFHLTNRLQRRPQVRTVPHPPRRGRRRPGSALGR